MAAIADSKPRERTPPFQYTPKRPQAGIHFLDLCPELIVSCLKFLKGPNSMQAAGSVCRTLRDLVGRVTCTYARNNQGMISSFTFTFSVIPSVEVFKMQLVTNRLRMICFDHAKKETSTSFNQAEKNEKALIPFTTGMIEIAKSQAKAGLLVRAKTTLEHTTKKIDPHISPGLQAKLLLEIATAQIEIEPSTEITSLLQQVKQIIDKMIECDTQIEKGFKAKRSEQKKLLTTHATLLAQAGFMEEAEQSFRKAIGIPNSVNPQIENARIFLQMAKSGCLGEIREASAKVREAIDNIPVEDEVRLPDSMSDIIRTMTSRDNRTQKENLMVGNAVYLAEGECWQEAIDAAHEIVDSKKRATALRKIGTIKAEAGLIDEAVNLFMEAAGLIRELPEKTEGKAGALAKIGTGLAKARLTNEAEALFTEAVEAAQLCRFKNQVMADIVKARKQAGLPKKSLPSYKRVLTGHEISQPEYETVTELALAGYFQRALRVVQQIQFPEHRIRALLILASMDTVIAEETPLGEACANMHLDETTTVCARTFTVLEQ